MGLIFPGTVSQAYFEPHPTGRDQLLSQHGAIQPAWVNVVLDEQPLEVICPVVSQMQLVSVLQHVPEVLYESRVDDPYEVFITELQENDPAILIDRVQSISLVFRMVRTGGLSIHADHAQAPGLRNDRFQLFPVGDDDFLAIQERIRLEGSIKPCLSSNHQESD